MGGDGEPLSTVGAWSTGYNLKPTRKGYRHFTERFQPWDNINSCSFCIELLGTYRVLNSPEVILLTFSMPLTAPGGVINISLIPSKNGPGRILGIYGRPPVSLSFADMAILLFAYIELKPYHLKGGSQALSTALLEKYYESNGTARFNCGVSRILVEEGKVTGVVTEQGDTIATDYVVSNASTLAVYTEMIDPEHVPEEQFKILGGSTIGPSSFTLFIGLDCEPAQVGIDETTNFLGTTTDMNKVFSSLKRVEVENDNVLLTCYNISDLTLLLREPLRCYWWI